MDIGIKPYYSTDRGDLYNCDCLDILPSIDKVDLVLTDPPYGLGMRTTSGGTTKNSLTKFMDEMKDKQWDNEIPSQKVFDEIFRCSKGQIIFGGNYFNLSPTRCFIVWDKMTYIPTMSRVEMAWTSFDSPAKYYQINSNNPDRVHPTQKPVTLFELILQDYSKENDLILDPFSGSGTTAVACEDLNRRWICIEKEEKYCELSAKRIEQFLSQGKLF